MSALTRTWLLLALAPVALTAERFESGEPVMGTVARITLYASSAGEARAGFAAAFDRIRALDAELSDYRPDSELMRLCRRAGEAVKVSDDLFRVLQDAQRVARDTNGAFDVTLGPLVRLWRRTRLKGRLPAPAEIARARGLCGYRRMTLDGRRRTVRLESKGMLLDLGGIAKGYAAAEALGVLHARGLGRALVAIGGDLALGDAPPEKPGWRVEIEHLGKVMELANVCVSTSGDAVQFVEIGGVRYSHILDPRTGVGVRNQKAVTVIAPEGAIADALATAISVAGEGLVDRYAGARVAR